MARNKTIVTREQDNANESRQAKGGASRKGYGRIAQTTSYSKRKAMEQHVVKHARNVRAKKVEKDNLRVGEAPKKKLTLACVENRESDSKLAESSGEKDQDVDGVQRKVTKSIMAKESLAAQSVPR
ncbi:hypothetical protein Syun_006950 [Stephania yunnanensis]|uniref:Uncharacterized protein n=1 Tax=Stephania yunnanensis TaxID=152371 RepID=A0AAP0KZB0_9MAGN